jgi:predicted Zn-dependent peptidase
LYQSLVKEKQLFSNINCFHFGSVDAGLLAIEGKLIKGIKMQDAEKAIEEELEKMRTQTVDEDELQKVKNKTESLMAFEDIPLMSRAGSLATYELLGDANLMNKELEHYQAVTAEDIKQESKNIFTEDNCSTLYYYSEN